MDKLKWLAGAIRPGRTLGGNGPASYLTEIGQLHAYLRSGEPALLAIERRLGRELSAAARRLASYPYDGGKEDDE